MKNKREKHLALIWALARAVFKGKGLRLNNESACAEINRSYDPERRGRKELCRSNELIRMEIRLNYFSRFTATLDWASGKGQLEAKNRAFRGMC